MPTKQGTRHGTRPAHQNRADRQPRIALRETALTGCGSSVDKLVVVSFLICLALFGLISVMDLVTNLLS